MRLGSPRGGARRPRPAPLLLTGTLAAWLLAAPLAGASSWGPPRQAFFDLIIRGGRVVDGSGNPWFIADVAVRAGEIAAIGDLADERAATVIDARGRVVAPGFIDLHSHADEGRISLANPDAAAALNLVTQGITTVVVGQDGRCQCPLAARAELYRRQGVGVNVVQLVGHGTIRARVMGRAPRAATPEEIERMVELVQGALQEGAAGLSSGLEYDPGRFSVTGEVVALARVVAEHGGFYISHQRGEGRTPMWWLPSTGGRPPDLIDAVQETIRIAGIALAGEGFPHPRFYGSYPRKLRRYVVEEGVITLAQAVRSSTSLPAQIAGLARRGMLRVGYAADLVIIDMDTVQDHATAVDPHRYSSGIDVVLINGQFAVRDGAPSGALAGEVLAGDEFVRRRPAVPVAALHHVLRPRRSGDAAAR